MRNRTISTAGAAPLPRTAKWAWWIGGAIVTWSIVALGAMAALAGYEASTAGAATWGPPQVAGSAAPGGAR